MANNIVRGRVLKWGNGAGIRISREDLRAAGLRIGQEADVQILSPDRSVDLSRLPVVRSPSGPTDVSRRHDDYIAKALDEKLTRRVRSAPRRH